MTCQSAGGILNTLYKCLAEMFTTGKGSFARSKNYMLRYISKRAPAIYTAASDGMVHELDKVFNTMSTKFNSALSEQLLKLRELFNDIIDRKDAMNASKNQAARIKTLIIKDLEDSWVTPIECEAKQTEKRNLRMNMILGNTESRTPVNNKAICFFWMMNMKAGMREIEGLTYI